ncbi:MAG TPA: GNAT family N-acetyltransferase [Synechococcales cyanobacterium M55_K2018_004]|nr:GNAT family N-acetyltransferase [Synechococcales cyanobacterium M55_K2018_004]
MDCSQIQFWVHEGSAPQSECAPINLSELKELFNAGAFWARDRREEELAIAIRNSHPVVSAWDGDRLIGFARATSDGIYRATIWDVVIHPDYQGAGLGRKLVETVVMHPHVNRAERVYLMTSNQQRFYERIGFEENKTTTMVLFNRVVYREELPVLQETMTESAV